MPIKIYFRWKVTLITILFALGAVRLSLWQWDRHISKQEYISHLQGNLKQDPVPLAQLLAEFPDLTKATYRRVLIEGEYDYSHEMILRNRRYEELPGVFAITPMKIPGEKAVLVNRGFIPLQYSEQELRKGVSRPERESFVGIIKESSPHRFLAPSDPETGEGLPRVDAWLRVDIPKIQKQIPYPLLPVYVEIMNTLDPTGAKEKIVQGKSDRDDMFFPTDNMHSLVVGRTAKPASEYPIPVFDTVVPPNRHFGYIFEWGFIALLCLLIGLVIQMRPVRHA